MTKVFTKAFRRPFERFGDELVTDAPTSLTDYVLDGCLATLIFDPANGVVGSRTLQLSDYNADDVSPTLVFDPQNKFTGANDAL